jgi:hypothetical protein
VPSAAISDVFVPDVSVDDMLNRMAARIAAKNVKNVRVERPTPTSLAIHHRYTPGWAIILGILGLLFFLLGLLFFLVKSTETMTVLGHEVEGGARFTVTGDGDYTVIQLLQAELRPPPQPLETGGRSLWMEQAWVDLSEGRTRQALDKAFAVMSSQDNLRNAAILGEVAGFAEKVQANHKRGANRYRAEALSRRVNDAVSRLPPPAT